MGGRSDSNFAQVASTILVAFVIRMSASHPPVYYGVGSDRLKGGKKMGWSKGRRQRFLSAHPICFNCGTDAATTIDHVPARACFVDGIGPEGFEFPACARCNRLTGATEQAVSLLIAIADVNKGYALEQIVKLAQGIANNAPHLYPQLGLCRCRRRALIEAAASADMPTAWLETGPLATLSEPLMKAFEAFGYKLAAALFYREVGKPLPRTAMMRVVPHSFANPATEPLIDKIVRMLPHHRVGDRPNLNFGDQFGYLWGEFGRGRTFGFCAQLGWSWFLIGTIDLTRDLIGRPGYVSHEEGHALQIAIGRDPQ